MLKKQKGGFMFVSLSKTIVRFGKMRLGLGIRITKKNVVYMGFILMMVYMLQACWGLLILCGWLAYAVFYWMYWCTKKLMIGLFKNRKEQPERE